MSNIDYMGMLFSIVQPDFDVTVLQKMLLNSSEQNIPSILIVSKTDLVTDKELEKFLEYLKTNFKDFLPIFPISTERNTGLENLKEYLRGKSVTISGPSGSGKSTLINTLLGKEVLITGEINSKTFRGRHTTTESRFVKTDIDTFIIDTPGFSSLNFPPLKYKKELEKLFPDFSDYFSKCKFRDCVHINEPGCLIKKNVENGNISRLRYDFYLSALNNIFK